MKRPRFPRLTPLRAFELLRDLDRLAGERQGAKCSTLPGPDELFLDIDDAQSLKLFLDRKSILGPLYVSHRQARSPSGKPHRFHVTVKLSRPVKDNCERIMLQALLGSDLFHEILSWKAETLGVESPTLFFEKPPAPPLDLALRVCPVEGS